MATTSCPDSLRSLAIGGIDFEGNKKGWAFPQAEGCGRFVFEVESHRVLQIRHRLIDGLVLRNHGDLDALGHIARCVTMTDDGVDRLLASASCRPPHSSPA